MYEVYHDRYKLARARAYVAVLSLTITVNISASQRIVAWSRTDHCTRQFHLLVMLMFSVDNRQVRADNNSNRRIWAYVLVIITSYMPCMVRRFPGMSVYDHAHETSVQGLICKLYTTFFRRSQSSDAVSLYPLKFCI